MRNLYFFQKEAIKGENDAIIVKMTQSQAEMTQLFEK